MKLEHAHTGTYGTMYYVRDMEKSVNYYKECIGLPVVFEGPDWAQFDVGNGHNLCLHAAKPDQLIDGKGILITTVKDIESVVTELKARGVEFIMDLHQVCENGFGADYRDPNGNVLSLFEYKG